MEIKDLTDFYIDLDGDIKASTPDTQMCCKFVTETTKLNSQYLFAEDVEEIKQAIKKINPDFILDMSVFKEYTIKTDKDDKIKGVKVFTDFIGNFESLDVIAMGVEITKDEIFKDLYFFADRNIADEFIQRHSLVYEIMNYDTHRPVLYSIKYKVSTIDGTESLVNFKTYYSRNDTYLYYSKENAYLLKQNLRFS